MSINEFKNELIKYLEWVKDSSQIISDETITMLATNFNDKRELLWEKLYNKYGMPDYILVIEYDTKGSDDCNYTCVEYEPFTKDHYDKIGNYIDYSGVLDKSYFSLLDKNDEEIVCNNDIESISSDDSESNNDAKCVSNNSKTYTNIYVMENIKKKLQSHFIKGLKD